MKGRILLVDDEEIVLRSCQRILGGEYDVDTAHDGLEALAKVNEGDFDVVVLDIKMPKMDGI
ncbi:MAG TPA: Fis family transcriptional regulator, partial [Chloroflexi bacterium]|nr:Fis family transcriptional regulator [Chloroflexota bacterium]